MVSVNHHVEISNCCLSHVCGEPFNAFHRFCGVFAGRKGSEPEISFAGGSESHAGGAYNMAF